MTVPQRRASDGWFYAFKRIPDILLKGEVDFAFVVLGFSMYVWAALGMLKQSDIVWFAKDFAFEWAPWVWFINYLFAGTMFIHCAVRHYPQGRCLLFGAYCCILWTWVMVGRPTASFSSGWTLNAVVVFMGAVLIQRSGKR
jgi:hypothetical protein